jgi:hypothetical protein
MKTRKLRIVLCLSTVIALVCLVGFFALGRLFDRQSEVVFQHKTARHTTAAVVRKEHITNPRPGHEWVVYYRVTGFPIYSFHKAIRSGEWEQSDIDRNATGKLAVAEQRRNQQSGDRAHYTSQKEYESLLVGDRLDVSFRLRADDESVEIINVEPVHQ